MKRALFTSGCFLFTFALAMPALADEPGTPPDKASMELANPAAVFCVDQGGTYEIRDGDKGQFGICKTVDGQEIDAWDYLRENEGLGENSQ